jgi:hypothetical protein
MVTCEVYRISGMCVDTPSVVREREKLPQPVQEILKKGPKEYGLEVVRFFNDLREALSEPEVLGKLRQNRFQNPIPAKIREEFAQAAATSYLIAGASDLADRGEAGVDMAHVMALTQPEFASPENFLQALDAAKEIAPVSTVLGAPPPGGANPLSLFFAATDRYLDIGRAAAEHW